MFHIYSHHDLKNNFTYEDLNNLKEKYIRRFNRFIYDVKNENKIFFLRYGIEDAYQIELFYDNIRKKNPDLEFYYVMLIYSENPVNYKIKYDNFIVINFYDYIDINKKYNDDMYFKVLEFDWYKVFNILGKY
jgi:hypothetical protein